MRHILAIFTLILMAALSSAKAAVIENGIYFNPAEPGRGYSIEQQGTQMTLIIYVYEAGSLAPVWYYASSGYNLNGSGYPTFTASLNRFSGGQCLGCAMSAPTGTSAGTATVTFSSSRTATITLGSGGPFGSGGAASIPITRFSFSDASNPLLGQWAFSYVIGSSPSYSNTWAGVVRCSSVGAPVNPGGTGFVSCSPSGYAGECYASGTFAGQCLMVYVGVSITENYQIQWPLNEFRGQYWLSGSSNRYRVQGVRAAMAGEGNVFGFGNAADALADARSSPDGSVEAAKRAADAAVGRAPGAAPDDALEAAFTALVDAVRGGR